MNTHHIPLLLTSSVIAYDTGVALSETSERIRFAIESIEQWLRIDPKLSIVLCDGSNYDFYPLTSVRFPTANIECLHFENRQDMVKRCGRGFGEGEIVSYASVHSKFIVAANCFAKCTSKLWVENYYDSVLAWNNNFLCKGVFNNVFSPTKKMTLSYIDTRFYVTNLEIYRQYFKNAHHNIRIDAGHSLEECFLDVIHANALSKPFFTTQPVIYGVGGGTGIHYKNSLKRKIKENIRLQLVMRNSEFSHLFSK